MHRYLARRVSAPAAQDAKTVLSSWQTAATMDGRRLDKLRRFGSIGSPSWGDNSNALVAELADALGSGPSSLNREWRFESSRAHQTYLHMFAIA